MRVLLFGAANSRAMYACIYSKYSNHGPRLFYYEGRIWRVVDYEVAYTFDDMCRGGICYTLDEAKR